MERIAAEPQHFYVILTNNVKILCTGDQLLPKITKKKIHETVPV